MATTKVVSVSSGSPTPAPPAGTQPSTGTTPPKGFRLNVLQMLQGVQTLLPSGSSVSTTSGPLTQAAMVSQLQAAMQLYQAVDGQGVALKQARQQLKTQLPEVKEEYAQMKAAIVAFFGASSPMLSQFGIKPKAKARPLTTAQKLAKVAKSAQTRKLRGTLGKRQKQAVVFSGSIDVSAEPSSGAGSTPTPAAVQAETQPAVSPSAPAATPPAQS